MIFFLAMLKRSFTSSMSSKCCQCVQILPGAESSRWEESESGWNWGLESVSGMPRSKEGSAHLSRKAKGKSESFEVGITAVIFHQFQPLGPFPLIQESIKNSPASNYRKMLSSNSPWFDVVHLLKKGNFNQEPGRCPAQAGLTASLNGNNIQ